jgi:glycosyltransferase involved in cell wall biosynthesis
MMHQYSLQRAKQNLLREYAAVLVASNHMAREYARQDLAARIVSLPSDEAGSPRGISLPSSGRLLFLGRFERSKGVQMALRSSAIAAAGLNRPIHVVMAGQGTLADRLKREAAKLTAADRRLTIEWPGWLTESERHAALAEADLLLMPSVWPEPFGLVGVEAASAGVPSIAFNVGGIADWLSDGVNGRLVSLTRDRVQAFADAIIETLRDPAALARMRHNAVATARRFTMTTHVERLESVFAEVIARTANQSTSA